MGTLTVQSENLGQLTGEAIVHKALEEVKKYQSQEDVDERFSLLNNAAQMSDALSEGFKLVRATALCMIEDIWDHLGFEVRKSYDYQFRLYAEKRCPDLTWTTIQNHMRAARTFVLGNIKPPVVEGKIIEFNPLETPISKLVLARSVAESGQINDNPKIWEILTDPASDVSELRKELFSETSKKAGIDPEIHYEVVGPYLIAKNNGDEVLLAEFNWEPYYDKNEIAVRAVDRLMKFLGVTLDEEIIYRQMKEKFDARQKAEERRIS